MTLPDPIVFVAGASGYVGRALLTELARRGAAAVAHVRPHSPREARALEVAAATSAALDRTPWELEALRATIAEHGPTHVLFVADGGREHEDLVRMLLQACAGRAGLRFVYLSSLGAGRGSRLPYLRRRARAEEAVRASGLGYTIARPGVIHGPDRGERRPGEAALALGLRAWSTLTRWAGARQHARRHRPTDGAELAFGLLHAAFNYTTINRVLEAEELRFDQANHDEHHVPATRRDGRH